MRSWAAGPAHLCGCGLTDVSCELVLIRLQVARVEYHTLFSSPALHLQGFSARLVVGADTDRERQPHGDGGSAVTDERDWAQTAFAAEQLLPGVRMLARVEAVGPGY